jgi:hypothetical protein
MHYILYVLFCNSGVKDLKDVEDICFLSHKEVSVQLSHGIKFDWLLERSLKVSCECNHDLNQSLLRACLKNDKDDSFHEPKSEIIIDVGVKCFVLEFRECRFEEFHAIGFLDSKFNECIDGFS